MNLFSHCVLTASDERQAEAFRALLSRRIRHGLYPREIAFHVYPDPPGRVGSGAGTLWALHRLYADIGYAPLTGGDAGAPSVLVLHAAGESRRLPVFAPEGKLFAPVPVASSSVLPPVVLDLQLALYLRFPWQPGQVVVGSGDVIIDFDTDALPHFDAPITGFGTPASFLQGSRHGVFAFDGQLRTLQDYYQKQPVDFLANHAVIEGTDSCALDIGIVAMTREYVSRLFRLAHAPLATNDTSTETVLDRIATGRLQFGLYLEQLSASLGTVDRAEYHRRLSPTSTLDPAGQDLFFDHLHDLSLAGHLARRCTFLHMGSVAEYPQSAAEAARSGLRPFYDFFDTAELSSDISAGHHGSTIISNSRDTEVVATGSGTVLLESCAAVHLRAAGSLLASGLTIPITVELPDGLCVDQRNLEGGTVVALYHQDDSFRPTAPTEVRFCSQPLTTWLADRGLSLEDAGVDTSAAAVDLLSLPLFSVSEDPTFLAGYLSPPEDGASWATTFRGSTRYSLRELNAATDVVARDEARQRLRTLKLRDQLSSGRGWRTAPAQDVAAAVDAGADTARMAAVAAETVDPVLRLYRAATLPAAGASVEPGDDRTRSLHFVAPGTWQARRRAVKADQIVWARSSVRFDLAGGWTDTPPYTNLFGGAVANIAVDLNGQPPIQVFVRPVAEPVIIFHSIDLGEREQITRSDQLVAYTDPSARFALPRAACALLGVGGTDPTDRASHPPDNLATTLRSLGGGFELSLLSAIPKGSGLGTSSVLGGVILAALFRFFGLSYTSDDLFLSVLELEQMLTTGGGWQDQIGGLAGGVKYVESRPAGHPEPLVHQLDPFLFEEPDYHGRMTLYYTGVTRLAKNILQDVVGRVNRREPAFLFTHQYLRALAREARTAVGLRDYPRLTQVIAGSWRANKLIHPSTTNDEIESLLSGTAPHWSAVKLLGAGGGGYGVFFSDTVDQANRLRDALAAYSADSPSARLVDFSLSRSGLQVSVS